MSPDRPLSLRNLGWTMAGLVAALVPHLTRLQPWIVAFVLLACAWRLLAEHRGWRLPGALLRAAIAVAATGGVLASYSGITGLDGGTALLALMSALKLLETRTFRDHAILIFIGWFLCLASFLYVQDVLTAAWVLPTVWLLAAALLALSRRSGGPSLRPFRTTGAMLLKALPIALVLFLFFPRLAGSFWGAPSTERGLTGIGEEMSPGDISELSLNDVVAFRVRFDGAPPPPPLRYWRGLVLQEFDGFTWTRGRAFAWPRQAIERAGAPVDYTVTLEATGQTMLFALEMPGEWPADVAVMDRDFALRARRPVHAVVQYDVRSWPRYRAGTRLGAALRNMNLQLPPDRNPETLALARRMRAAAGSDEVYVQSVLDMFRRQEFFYTLTPPGLARDSVDDFLFNTRRGFCEHYASAFTTLMRAAGIPARVVGGYQGGDWNPIGEYLIVRQSHAHAWSEIWLDGRGWTRVDPTAAVAPQRVERGVEAAVAAGAGAAVLDSGLLWRAQMAWDSVNALWNDWVVQFNRASQESLLQRFGFSHPGWREFGLALALGLALGAALSLGWLAWEFRPRRQDEAAAAYGRFLARLARRGIERRTGEAPGDFAARVQRLRPDLAPATLAITEAYVRLRYLPAPASEDLRRLRALVARFRP